MTAARKPTKPRTVKAVPEPPAEQAPADEVILNRAVAEAIAAYRLGFRIDRHIPVDAVARSLELASYEATARMEAT